MTFKNFLFLIIRDNTWFFSNLWNGLRFKCELVFQTFQLLGK